MKYFGLSNKGKVRGNNEDYFHIPLKNDNAKLFVVADGMGGANAGEIASALAVSAVVCFVEENLEYADKTLLLRKAITRANKAVFDTSRAKKEYENMGTTVVCALIDKNELYVANVGDSRCYLLRGGEFKQLTKDHSYVQEMLDKGLLTPQEAMLHPNRNLITRAIGTGRFIDIDVFINEFLPDDRILLASDGLTGMVPKEKMEEIIKNNSAADAAQRLIDAANDGGGRDNITAILIYNSEES